jgi:hypothetical protein
MPMWRPAGPETPLPARSGEPTTAQLSPEPAGEPTRVEGTRAKIKAGGHASPYRLRKQLPEPVFGQIKQARGFRQFLLRGFEKVRAGPQPPQAGPEKESVRTVADACLSRLTSVLPVGEIMKRPRSRKYRIRRWSLAQQKNQQALPSPDSPASPLPSRIIWTGS